MLELAPTEYPMDDWWRRYGFGVTSQYLALVTYFLTTWIVTDATHFGYEFHQTPRKDDQGSRKLLLSRLYSIVAERLIVSRS